MQVSSNLSAADVLAGKLAPNGTFQPKSSPWSKANEVSLSDTAKSSGGCSKGAQPAFTTDSTETVATAAGALLGLQNENSRMSHKQVEQHRRLKAKQYFDELRCLVPGGTDSKNDRNRVLQLAIDHLKALTGQGTAIPTIKEEGDKDEAARLSEEDTSSEPLMFEMDGDDTKKLSHNEVEQRRRLQAKLLYEELRQLLPNAAKFDKNTVLLSCIHILKQKQGVSEDALSRMVEGLNSQENEGKDGARGARTKGEAGKLDGVRGLGATAGEWEGTSESPCDVATFADMFSSAASKSRRKRAAPCDDVFTATSSDATCGPLSARGDEHDDVFGRKRSRASSLEPLSSSSSSAPSSASVLLDGLTAREAAPGGESEGGKLDALTLLSSCATELSHPSTPLSAPASCGTSSLILALHPLSLSQPRSEASGAS